MNNKSIKKILDSKALSEVLDFLNKEEIKTIFQSIHDEEGNIVKYEMFSKVDSSNYNIREVLDVLISSKKYSILRDLLLKNIEIGVELINEMDINMSINFEYHDLIDDETINYLTSLADNGFNSNNLTIELIENNWPDQDKVLDNIKILKNAGYKIAMDDFGSDSSTLDRLNLLIVNGLIDIVKLDGSIIKGLHQDVRQDVADILQKGEVSNHSILLIENIVRICRDNNIKIIAEYVENRDIFDKLKLLGVDFFQGYHFGKPKENI